MAGGQRSRHRRRQRRRRLIACAFRVGTRVSGGVWGLLLMRRSLGFFSSPGNGYEGLGESFILLGKLVPEALEWRVLVIFKPLNTLMSGHWRSTYCTVRSTSLALVGFDIFSHEMAATMESRYEREMLHVLKDGDK